MSESIPTGAESGEPFAITAPSGLSIIGDQWGSRSGPPVLLLHGGGQNRHAWKGSAAALAAAGYFVTALDARGHGDSGWSPEGHYEIEHLAGDLMAVLATLDRRPVVVGASMGGMTAIAAQGMADSQLFAAVILVDVTPRMELSGVARILDFMTAHPEGFDSLEQAAEAIAAYNPHRERSGNPAGLGKVLQERGGRWHWRWDPRVITSKVEMMSGDPVAVEQRMSAMAAQMHEAAKRLEVPTLLVRGAQSDLVSADSIQEFLAAVPHASYVDVSGTGHMVAGDDNDAFTTAVLDFLGEHVPGDGEEGRLLVARQATANAVRRFGHALVNHDAPLDLLEAIATNLDAASAKVERGPVRDRLATMMASERTRALLTGVTTMPPADGSRLDFAPYGLVGGLANPLGVDAIYTREGAEVVATLTLGAAFEGPPGRAHGGVVSAVIDETMTALLTMLGTAAFTLSLQIEYIGPVPLHAPLQFRAQLCERGDRTLVLSCEGSTGDQVFVKSTGTFVEVDLRRLVAEMGRIVAE